MSRRRKKEFLSGTQHASIVLPLGAVVLLFLLPPPRLVYCSLSLSSPLCQRCISLPEAMLRNTCIFRKNSNASLRLFLFYSIYIRLQTQGFFFLSIFPLSVPLSLGKSQCTWSSCEEGCTKTVYTCWQVEVEYELPTSVSVGDAFLAPAADGRGRPRLRRPRGRGRLFPNVKGCGYPPRTVCSEFIAAYSTNGSAFRCFVSRTDPALVVVDLDLDQVGSSVRVTYLCRWFTSD